ncbi:uncharacterized protein LOC6571285 [Drosophila grimshawi]|uniref:uncharacterized protein LOC6571285 n=1 Tax=Drosophila grimshawi TaxID=7222 RepID=UPI001C931FAD|nr:uncharacterized protein LOC6571285 [Drosophila grimshawi]
MQRLCCKCGVLYSSRNNALCLEHGGGHVTHCFCCAQPPRLKCIKCNIWREMDLMKEHAPCLKGPLHVFVYSEPWPPFPDQATLASPFKVELAAEEPQIELGIEDLHIKLEALELESPHDIIQTISDPDKVPEIQDVKPQIIRKSRWVTIREINRWSHCQRCGFEHSKSKGWLHHAQMCAQDPKYKTDMFFIYLHTKAWCGTLVQDAFWEKHTDPEKGDCAVCRSSRRCKKPLPYQPKAPPR